MRRQLVSLAVALTMAIPLWGQQAASVTLPSEETVNSFMRQTFGYDPSVTWKISSIKPSTANGLAEVVVVVGNQQGQQVTTFYVTPDGKHALVGDLIPFGAKPFAPALQALEKDANGPSRGPAVPSVLLVEFSDLQCPHCKEAQPIIAKLLADEPGAKFVFEQYPLPQHNWAAKGAAYADCIGRLNKESVWKFIQGTFDEQSNITEANADEKLNTIADASGAKSSEIAACAAKPETRKRIDDSIALGTSVGVNSTPTLYVNGRRISNMNAIPYDVLKGLVEYGANNTAK
jgi:protein-disulfide isomerase